MRTDQEAKDPFFEGIETALVPFLKENKMYVTGMSMELTRAERGGIVMLGNDRQPPWFRERKPETIRLTIDIVVER